MDADKGIWLLKEKKLIPIGVSNNSVWASWNRIKFHNQFEGIEHFLSKAIIGYLIYKKRDGLLTEYEYPDCQVIDILQIKNKSPNELIGYQIETNRIKDKSFDKTDVITIDFNKFPEHIKLVFKDLKEYFLKYII